MPLTIDIDEALYSINNKAETIALGNQRFTIFQENLAQPTYPPSREFDGRFRVHNGDEVVAEGRHYPGALALRGNGLGVGVFLKNMWQMSPKTLAYAPVSKSVQIGIWPGKEAGDLNLMRTEVKRPKHYQEFADKDPLYHDTKYGPAYVPHDLRHSAMGLSRTHEIIFWFETEPDKPDPIELTKLFAMPFVPFVSGDWNVKTGVMGLQVLPGQYRNEIESVNHKMMTELRHQIEQHGWYGMLQYGNVRYAYDKKIMNWMHYHPKYAWYNSKMDVSTVHYHEDESLIGNMIRHGGFDPWAGARCAHGEHAPLCGIPIHYYVTGSERAGDIIHLIGQRNYQNRNFNHGRKMDTDINTMMLYYEFTLDGKYYDRAVEYVNYYHRTLDEAREELTYPEYRTTALRTFYEVCEEENIRRKIGEIFLASYATFREQREWLGNLEMAAFAYEISPNREAAERLEKIFESWSRLISGQLGWLDNMVLRGMNDFAKMNAVNYGLYWLQEKNRGQVKPIRIQPDGGTFSKPTMLTLACDTPEAIVCYTLDGSEPTGDSPKYNEPLLIKETCTIKAKSFLKGFQSQPAASAIFVIGGPSLPRKHLGLWFRADAGIARNDSTVLGWSEQSGHGRHAQLVGNRAPEFVANRINGQPVVRGGSRRAMRLHRLLPLKDNCTFIFVAAYTGENAAVVGDGDDGHIGLRPQALAFLFSAGEKGTYAQLHEPWFSLHQNFIDQKERIV